MSSVKTTPSVDGQQSLRSTPKIACSTSPEAPTVAATRSIGSLARSRRLTLTFGISPLSRQRNWAMAGGSNGYRAAPVKRRSTRGRLHHCQGRPDRRRVSLFRQALLNWTTRVAERLHALSGTLREKNWVSLLRALDTRAVLRRTHSVECASAVDRARGSRRRTGSRRRVLPRAPLRTPARLAVPAPRRRRRADEDD